MELPSRASIALLLACASIGSPTVAEAKVGHIPRGGTVVSFAKQPTAVSVEGSVVAWSKKAACPPGLKRCYRGLVRLGGKTVAVPELLADADLDLGRNLTGKIVAAYVRCSPGAGCSAYSFDPTARAETKLPLAVTPGCSPAAPRISGIKVAYMQEGAGCGAPGIYVADTSTGAVAWQAWKTAADVEAANADELGGNTLYWSTRFAGGDTESRMEADRIYSGRIDTHVSSSIRSGTTSAEYSFQSFSVSSNKLFYLLSFSGDEQGASVSIGYQTVSGPARSCRIKGLGTEFDPHVPGSFLLSVAARDPYLYVVLTREDTRNKDHPRQLIRYRLSSLKRTCSRG
jgi:hypothetical protein